jgi:hypothetical protein
MTYKISDDPFYQTREKTWFDIYGQNRGSIADYSIDDYLLTEIMANIALYVRRQIIWQTRGQITDQLHWPVYYWVEEKALIKENSDELR